MLVCLQGPPIWFKWHRRLQVVGLLFTVIAFIIALAMTADVNKQHFGNSHAKLGLAVTIFALLQPLNAFIRPKPQPRTTNRKARIGGGAGVLVLKSDRSGRVLLIAHTERAAH
jgi:hypothetical protein